jgi:hypothetical protein
MLSKVEAPVSADLEKRDSRKWVYLVLQVSVTLETLLLLARWLGWVPSP